MFAIMTVNSHMHGIRPEQIKPGLTGFSPPTNLTGQILGTDLAIYKKFSWPKPGLKYYFLLFYMA